jgi:hypothetical protein
MATERVGGDASGSKPRRQGSNCRPARPPAKQCLPLDNEDNPPAGGIYPAPLTGSKPPLTTLVRIGDRVPGERHGDTFNRLGEGLSYDGWFVAFWGAWGSETTTLILQCPNEGNQARLAYCEQQYPNGFTTTVPVNQGITLLPQYLAGGQSAGRSQRFRLLEFLGRCSRHR